MSLNESLRSDMNSETFYMKDMLDLVAHTAARAFPRALAAHDSSTHPHTDSEQDSAGRRSRSGADTSQFIASLVRLTFTLGNLTVASSSSPCPHCPLPMGSASPSLFEAQGQCTCLASVPFDWMYISMSLVLNCLPA